MQSVSHDLLKGWKKFLNLNFRMEEVVVIQLINDRTPKSSSLLLFGKKTHGKSRRSRF